MHKRTRARTHTHTHTHTHTRIHTITRTLKFCNFLKRSRNQIHEQLIQHWSVKFNTSEVQVFLMETSGLIQREK